MISACRDWQICSQEPRNLYCIAHDCSLDGRYLRYEQSWDMQLARLWRQPHFRNFCINRYFRQSSCFCPRRRWRNVGECLFQQSLESVGCAVDRPSRKHKLVAASISKWPYLCLCAMPSSSRHPQSRRHPEKWTVWSRRWPWCSKLLVRKKFKKRVIMCLEIRKWD